MRLEGDYVSLAPLPRLCFGGGESTDDLIMATYGANANTHGAKFCYFIAPATFSDLTRPSSLSRSH